MTKYLSGPSRVNKYDENPLMDIMSEALSNLFLVPSMAVLVQSSWFINRLK